MSIELTKDPQTGIRTVRATGEVSIEEWIATFGDVYGRAERGEHLLLLWDLSMVTKMPTWEEMEILIDTVAKNRPRVSGRSAIVATDEFVYDLSRMVQLHLEGAVVQELRVFRGESEAKEWLSKWGMVSEIPAFLDRLDQPVFLMNGEVTVLAANRAAQEYVGGTVGELENRLCGDVIRCFNADRPGGCGKTDQCPACTIRNSVLHTITSGEPLRKIPTQQLLKTPCGTELASFRISTDMFGPFVCLRIDRRTHLHG